MKVRPANLELRPHKILPVVLFALFALLLPLPTRAQYQTIPVPDGGIISGTVKWTGERPKPLTLPISKDAAVCDPQKAGSRDLNRILINSDGEVENTVVYLKNVTHGKPFELASMHQVLDQKNCRYIPHISVVPLNAQFGMKSSDAILHTIHMIGAESYNLPFPMTDVVVAKPLRNTGLIDLKCNAGHFWMNGIVMVVDSPYYAITDSHGEFRLTGVPPGDYEIVAWHEGWKVDHEEQVLDVGTQTKTKRYFFSEPMTWEKKVTVAPSARTTTDFTLSEK